jgi:Flp pilus assembly protein TadB
VTVPALGLPLVVAALILGFRDLVRPSGGGRRATGVGAVSGLRMSSGPGSAGGAVGRVARRYDASAMGRRLERRLWAAQVGLSPSGWRCAQLLVTMPLVTVLAGLGMGGLAALIASASISRAGGRLVLWLRRKRSREATAAASPAIARALGTELSAWGSGTQAVLGAAARCRDVAPATRVLELAAARVALGGEPAPSLRRAVEQLEPELRSSSPVATVISIFALHRHDAAATAAALDRLAGAIEDDRAVRREARAAVGEVRMSALAVPAVAAATAAMLLSADPPALAAALSFPLLPLLLGAVVIVALAAALARRLVAV